MKALLIGYNGIEEVELEEENGSTCRSIQKLVGSPFDVFGALYEGVSLYVDDNGVFNQAPNRAVYANAEMAAAGYLRPPELSTSFRSDKRLHEGDLFAILFGPILAVGFDPATGGDRELTEAEAERIMRDFGPNAPMGPGSGADAIFEIKMADAFARLNKTREPLDIEHQRKGRKMKHVLLKLNAKAGYALVYLPENEKFPFAWVWGYDHVTGSWSQGHYRERYEDALAGYEAATGIRPEQPKVKCFPVSGRMSSERDFRVLVAAESADEAWEAFGEFLMDHVGEIASATGRQNPTFSFGECSAPVMVDAGELDIDGRFKID